MKSTKMNLRKDLSDEVTINVFQVEWQGIRSIHFGSSQGTPQWDTLEYLIKYTPTPRVWPTLAKTQCIGKQINIFWINQVLHEIYRHVLSLSTSNNWELDVCVRAWWHCLVNIRLKEGRVVIFTTPLETKTWDTGNLASASLNVDSFWMKSPHCPSTSTSTIDIATNRLVRYCYNT